MVETVEVLLLFLWGREPMAICILTVETLMDPRWTLGKVLFNTLDAEITITAIIALHK
jgi:hypothetical protein